MSANESRISKALTDVKLNRSTTRKIDMKDLKLIILSDHHKGQKDGADDFRKCKAAYHAALGYYFSAGYHLYLIGDVEELWENRPKKVIQSYSDTFELEQRFALAGRYTRILGNHDDIWQYQREVDNYLKEYIAQENEEAKVFEGIILSVYSGEENLGDLFIVHGHQGTGDADKYSKISRFFVRYIWRNIQRLTKISYTTPAKDFELRHNHEIEMFDWANQQDELILIAGHTHHPVFSSESHENYLLTEKKKLTKSLNEEKNPVKRREIQDKINHKSAELEWVIAKSDGVKFEIEEESKPCYFNTGCCSFADGDITGIEIADGEIQLVRWPNDEGYPQKKVLRMTKLAELFKRCK